MPLPDKLIRTALTQVGYHEKTSEKNLDDHKANSGNGNYTKYGAWLNINPAPWCHAFVSWCAHKAEISANIIPKTASCDSGMEFFKKQKRFEKSIAYGGSYIPRPGDIMYCGNASRPWDSTHSAIITGCDNKHIYSIDGNSGDMVEQRVRELVSDFILGFGKPKY